MMIDETKVALVTGANKGIGKAIVRGLAQKGMTVLLGARNPERGIQAARELSNDGTVLFLQLDVTDEASVQAAAREIAARYGRLDVLVNNAGIGLGASRPGEETVQNMRMVYETNVFAVVAVTNALLPLLRLSRAGRIVNVTSLRGSLGDAGAYVGTPIMAYSSSKTALNALTVHYAPTTHIKVNGAAPGYVATDFNGFHGTRTPDEGAAIAVKLATLDEDGPTGGVFDDNRQISW